VNLYSLAGCSCTQPFDEIRDPLGERILA